MSLTRKVYVLLAVVFVTLTAAFTAVTRQWERALEDSLVEEVEQLLTLRADGLDAQVRQSRQALSLLASLPVVRTGHASAVSEQLAHWEAVATTFDGLYFMTLDGRIQPSVGEAFSVKDTDYYPRMVQGQPVVASPQGQPILLLTALVKGADGRLRGALVGTLLLERLREMVNRNLKDPMAQLLIFDAAGVPLSVSLSQDAEATQASMASITVGDALRTQLAQRASGPTEEGLRLTVQGEPHWVFEQRVDELGWQLLYLKPESALLGPVQRARWMGWALGLGMLVLAVLAVVRLRRQYLSPLQTLLQAQQTVSQGDRSVRVRPQGGQEVLHLQQSFNAMLSAMDLAEQRLRTVFELFPYPVLLTRLSDQRLVDVNPAFCASSGKKRENVLEHTLAELGLNLKQSESDSLAREQLATGQLDAKTIDYVDEKGERRWALFSSRIFELNGERLALSVSVTITDLKNSEAKLEAIFNGSPVAMVVMNRRNDNEIISVNNAWLEQFGYLRNEVLGVHAGDLNFWVSQERRAAFLARLVQQGEVHDLEDHFVKRDGTVLTCRLNATQLQVGGQSLLIVAQQDVTAVRAAQAAVRVSEERFRELFDGSPVPQIHFDPHSQQVRTNRRWNATIGFRPEYTQDPATWWAAIYPDPALREQAREAWHAYLKRAREVRTELPPVVQEIFCEDGLWRHMQTRVSFAGESMVISMQDISELKTAQAHLQDLNATLEQRVQLRTEELAERNAELVMAAQHLEQTQSELARQEKLASLGALVAGVSHELNTPIGNARVAASTLLGASKEMQQSLTEGKLTKSGLNAFVDKVSEGAVITERNLMRASDLISSFKQVAVDQSSLARRPFNLAELVHEVSVVMQPTIKAKQVVLQTEVPEGLRLDGYPGPLTQVLINLINNAVVHGFAGRESGTIAIAARADGPQHAVIVVHDDGCGIPADHQGKIFDPFFTTRLGQGGSGLGLNIVLNIVQDALGGRIRLLEAGPEGGSTFEVRLPLVAPQATAAGAASRPGV